MLKEFEIVRIPVGRKMERRTQNGRILLTPAEFKFKIEQMKISTCFLPLPVEMEELKSKE